MAVVLEAPAPDPPRGVGRRVFAALATIALGQGVTAVVQLIAVPVLLVAWGERLYGEWLILFAVPAYLSLSDLGFASVAGNQMTMLAARGDRQAASDIFRAVVTLLLGVSLVLAVGAASVAWVLPLPQWFSFEELSRRDTGLILVLLACQVVVTIQASVLDAGFRAGEKYPVGALCRQLVRIAEVASVPVAAVAGLSPVGAAATFLGVTIFGNTTSWFVLRRAVPWLAFHFGRVDFGLVKPLIRPALAYAALPLGNAVSIQGVVLVVGAVAGPVAVVAFQTARTLSRLPQGIMYAINQSVWPEVSSAFGAGRIAVARSLHRHSVQGALLMTVVITVILLPLGPLIVSGWTGGKVEVTFVLFGSLLLVVGANSIWYTSSVVLVATNSHQRMALLYLSGSIVALALAAMLVRSFGTHGAGFALLAIDALMAGYVLPHSLRLVDDSPRDFFRELLRPPSLRLRRQPAPTVESTNPPEVESQEVR